MNFREANALAGEIFAAKQQSRSMFDKKIREVSALVGINASELTREYNRASNANVRLPSVNKPAMLAAVILAASSEK